ncbi:MAG: hypothetical protein AB7E85_02575 [Pseudobdellovibrionaceae bacterium]
MLKAWTSSPLFMLFYGFFAVFLLPFIGYQLMHETWIFNLFYAPKGIADNLLTIFYFLALALSVWMLKSGYPERRFLWLLFAVALFMAGEALDWGGAFLTNADGETARFGVIALLEKAFLGWGLRQKSSEIGMMIAIRFVVAAALLIAVGYVWYRRHDWKEWSAAIKASPATPYIVLYLIMIGGAILVAFVDFQAPRRLEALQATLSLNAACIWFLLAYRTKIME